VSNIKRQPTNINEYHPTKFKIVLTQLPSVEYFCQSVEIPSISIAPTERANPFGHQFVSGTHPVYEPLILTVILDEDFRSWDEIHSWMRGEGFPTGFDEYAKQKNKFLYSDLILFGLTNSNIPNIEFWFRNAFPSSLSGIRATSTADNQETIVFDVTFRYDYYDFKRTVKPIT
jgi:hypothetical protein